MALVESMLTFVFVVVVAVAAWAYESRMTVERMSVVVGALENNFVVGYKEEKVVHLPFGSVDYQTTVVVRVVVVVGD